MLIDKLQFNGSNGKAAVSETVIADTYKIGNKIQAYPSIGERLITS